MSEFKIGDEVQFARENEQWVDAIYCGADDIRAPYRLVFLNMNGTTDGYRWSSVGIRRKLRVEKRMMQWCTLYYEGVGYAAIEVSELKDYPHAKLFGAPFEHTFEVVDD